MPNIAMDTTLQHVLQTLEGVFIPEHELTVTDKVIGRGGFGEVRRGVYRGLQVAVKLLPLVGVPAKQMELTAREVLTLSTCSLVIRCVFFCFQWWLCLRVGCSLPVGTETVWRRMVDCGLSGNTGNRNLG